MFPIATYRVCIFVCVSMVSSHLIETPTIRITKKKIIHNDTYHTYIMYTAILLTQLAIIILIATSDLTLSDGLL